MAITRVWIGGLVAAALVAALLVLGVYAYSHIIISGTDAGLDGAPASQNAMPARISAFKVERPNLVVEGSGLSRVEIWAVPAGTGVSESDHQLMGNATLQADGASVQVWTLSIPASSMLVTEVYAKGFGREGAEAVRMPLPYTGATSIHDALWGSGSAPTSSSGGGAGTTQRNFSFSLSVGQQRTVGALTVRLLEITGDSRCPQNAVCIWAGEVTAAVQLAAAGLNQTAELHSAHAAPYAFQNYRIEIEGVSPPRRTGGAISQDSYRIDFTVERL